MDIDNPDYQVLTVLTISPMLRPQFSFGEAVLLCYFFNFKSETNSLSAMVILVFLFELLDIFQPSEDRFYEAIVL